MSLQITTLPSLATWGSYPSSFRVRRSQICLVDRKSVVAALKNLHHCCNSSRKCIMQAGGVHWGGHPGPAQAALALLPLPPRKACSTTYPRRRHSCPTCGTIMGASHDPAGYVLCWQRSKQHSTWLFTEPSILKDASRSSRLLDVTHPM